MTAVHDTTTFGAAEPRRHRLEAAGGDLSSLVAWISEERKAASAVVTRARQRCGFQTPWAILENPGTTGRRVG